MAYRVSFVAMGIKSISLVRVYDDEGPFDGMIDPKDLKQIIDKSPQLGTIKPSRFHYESQKSKKIKSGYHIITFESHLEKRKIELLYCFGFVALLYNQDKDIPLLEELAEHMNELRCSI